MLVRGQNGGENMEIDFKRTAELVVQIQNGDDSAFEELYHLTSKRAFSLQKNLSRTMTMQRIYSRTAT